MKSGFYNTHSYKAQQRQGWQGTITFANDTTNPLDTAFGFANAAVGVFSSYNQFSKYVEGSYVYNNTEGYVQDNWKVTSRWTLDYGVRLVHQQPQYDELAAGVEFLPEQVGGRGGAGALPAGCAAQPCTGSEPPGAGPAHATAARAQHGGRDRHAGAEFRQPDERAVPVRPGHRQDDLHLAGARAWRRDSARPTT